MAPRKQQLKLTLQSPKRVAIGYCRCSTEEQSLRSAEFNTLQAQEKMIRNYHAIYHPEWTLEIVHEVRSAKDTNRPQLQKILQRVQQGEVQAIIVYKFDRLSRSVKDLLTIESLLKEYGTDLISLKEQIDTTTPIGKLQRNLLASIAEFERETIAERIRDKLREMGYQGLWVRGRPPFGYKVVNKRLEVVPERARWVQYAFHRFRETGSAGRVVAEMNANPEFRRVWSESGHKRELRTDSLQDYFLSNPVYTGGIWVKGECLHKDAHEAIIPKDLYEIVQALLPQNRPYCGEKAKHEHEHFYLRGRVFCYECGGALTPYYVYGNAGIVRYYAHPRKTACQVKRVNAEYLHRAVWSSVRAVAEMDTRTLQELVATYREEYHAVQAELRALQEEIDRLLNLYQSGVSVPDIAERLQALHTRRASLARICVPPTEDVGTLFQEFQEALAEWELVWDNLTHQERRETLVMVVARAEVIGNEVRTYIPVASVPGAWLESNSSMVERSGFEPPTSCMPCKRSPS